MFSYGCRQITGVCTCGYFIGLDAFVLIHSSSASNPSSLFVFPLPPSTPVHCHVYSMPRRLSSNFHSSIILPDQSAFYTHAPRFTSYIGHLCLLFSSRTYSAVPVPDDIISRGSHVLVNFSRTSHINRQSTGQPSVV